MFNHERDYRGTGAEERISRQRIVVMGCGALGSGIAITLCRMGFRFIDLVDNGRVEDQNLGTQQYDMRDVGAMKVHALWQKLYDIVGDGPGELNVFTQDITKKRLKVSDHTVIIIDCFDNAAARSTIEDRYSMNPIIHAGMGDGLSEVTWHPRYKVPTDPPGTETDQCEYPLSATLVQMTVGMVCEAITRRVIEGKEYDLRFTLGDFNISAQQY